jgi:hypothetical protein
MLNSYLSTLELKLDQTLLLTMNDVNTKRDFFNHKLESFTLPSLEADKAILVVNSRSWEELTLSTTGILNVFSIKNIAS